MKVESEGTDHGNTSLKEHKPSEKHGATAWCTRHLSELAEVSGTGLEVLLTHPW